MSDKSTVSSLVRLIVAHDDAGQFKENRDLGVLPLLYHPGLPLLVGNVAKVENHPRSSVEYSVHLTQKRSYARFRTPERRAGSTNGYHVATDAGELNVHGAGGYHDLSAEEIYI